MEKVSLMGCWEPPGAALAALLLWVLAPREGRTVKLSIKFSLKHVEELLVQWGSVKWSQQVTICHTLIWIPHK